MEVVATNGSASPQGFPVTYCPKATTKSAWMVMAFLTFTAPSMAVGGVMLKSVSNSQCCALNR